MYRPDVCCRFAIHASSRTRGDFIVDATVIFYVTNGNVYVPVMVIAGKAANFILRNTTLPPAAFYRTRPNSAFD